MLLHRLQVLPQVAFEICEVCIASEAREPRKFARAAERKRMRLLVRHHLQAVLHAAQIAVGGAQIVAHLRADPVEIGEAVERLKRLARAERPLPASCDELLRLHEEFDLANAAAPELEIMASDRDLAVTLCGVDLPLHRVDVRDGVVIEIFAPDIGAESFEEGVSPAAMSPATGRALIMAARSQFWPKLS